MSRRNSFSLPSHSAEAHFQAPMPTTSMHGCSPVFTNDYILHEIFSHIPKLEEDTLARAALVSRAFTEPAIRALWRDLHSFSPLLKLLSGSIERVSKSWQGEIVYTISSKIMEDEWARFQIYAPYVRSLTLSGNQYFEPIVRERVHPSAFPILFRKAGLRPILPHLETLCWDISSHEGIYTDLIPFMTPSLRCMNLHFQKHQQRLHSDALRDLLSVASSKAPSLRSLTLVISPSASVCLEPFAESTALETLYLAVLSEVRLDQICKAVNLVDLTILLAGVASWNYQNNVIPRGDFPALHTLSLTGELDKVSSLLDVFYAPCLQRLSFYVTYGPTHVIRSLNTISTNVADHFGQSLRSIRIMCRGREILRTSSLHPASDDIFDIRPLLELHELTSVDIYMPGCWFSPSDFGQMALAWPMVQQFELGYDSEPVLTGNDLMGFARCCPDLTSLKLSAVAFPHDVSPDSPTIPHGLKELSLSMQYSASSAAEGQALYDRAARWIDRIFPNLDLKKCRDTRDFSSSSLFSHLEQLRSARPAERSEAKQ